MIAQKNGYTATELAHHLLKEAHLTEWQIGFLTIALEELAEFNQHITAFDCIHELAAMNHRQAENICTVVQALTGLSFDITWDGPYGHRIYHIAHQSKTVPIPHNQIQHLHRAYGWGSNAHIHALDHISQNRPTPKTNHASH